jgi:type I restriction enzyme S subunit
MSKYPMVTISDIIVEGGMFTDGDWIESKDQNNGGNIRLIQLADIGDGEFLNKSDKHITEMKAIELNCTILKAGDILVARMPDPIGRACIFPGFDYKCVTAIDVCIIRPNNLNVFNKWLKHIINSPKFRNNIQKYSTGTTRKRISRKNLAKIEFPFPPLVEQKRIATILDQADALRLKRDQSLSRLDDLVQSVFLEMFGDPGQNKNGWKVTTVGDICHVKGGKRLPKGHDYSIAKSPFRYIRVADINNGQIDPKKLNYLKPETHEKIKRYKVHAGDVIISIAGTVGVTVPVGESLNSINLTENAAKLVPKKENLYTANFLSFMLQTNFVKQQIEALTGQVTIKKLALFRIEKIKVVLPPIEQQKEFDHIVQEIIEEKTLMKKQSQYFENLFHSLQHSAFSGELNVDEY